MATVEHCLYCFEVLTAHLEKRNPMTLLQVQTTWAEYPKGLEANDLFEPEAEAEAGAEADDDSSSDVDTSSSISTAKKGSRPKVSPALRRLAGGSSNSASSSSSSSSASLAPSTSTAASESESTRPSSSNSSSTSFTPIGMDSRRTSQRADITESPLFVTWNTVSTRSSSRSLRGCIGTFEGQPLASGLSSYALTSALSDVRFSPIAQRELPKLEVAVTLLTDFETCSDPMDWEIGVHGLRMNFYHHHKRYSSCYLPDVAVEQGWTKEECLISLMRKAGWVGKREKWRDVGDLKLVRYQGKAESVEWEEYKRWRDWVEEKK
jgi:uncharacterized protein (TIGR00296 family)